MASAAQLPAPTASTLGGVKSVTCPASELFFALSTSGAFSCGQLSFSDLLGQIANAQLPTLSAGVIYKGTGSPGQAASGITDDGSTITISEPLNIATQPVVKSFANEGTTGTAVNKLAKLSGATVLTAATTDTGGVVGIVHSGAGTTGSALVAFIGRESCVFDGATTAGHYVQISATAAGQCHDVGASFPSSGQAIGRVLSTNAGAGTYLVELGPEVQAASGGGGGVSSVNIVNGTGLSESGTCNSTSSINCTVSLSTPVSTTNGGTGVSSPAAHTIPVNEGGSAQSNTGTGTAGQYLVSNGSGADPSFLDGNWVLLGQAHGQRIGQPQQHDASHFGLSGLQDRF